MVVKIFCLKMVVLAVIPAGSLTLGSGAEWSVA